MSNGECAGEKRQIVVREVSRAMFAALFHHKLFVWQVGGDADYWQYVDANHRHLMAVAALDALRTLPVEQRMEAMGMEWVGSLCDVSLHGFANQKSHWCSCPDAQTVYVERTDG